MLFPIVLGSLLSICMFAYWILRPKKVKPYQRKNFGIPEIVSCGADDETSKPKRKQTDSQKEKAELKTYSAMVARAQTYISDFSEDNSLKLCLTTLFYGRDVNNRLDLRVIAEFGDESIGIFYATETKEEDVFILFVKDQIKDLLNLCDRQYHR